MDFYQTSPFLSNTFYPMMYFDHSFLPLFEKYKITVMKKYTGNASFGKQLLYKNGLLYFLFFPQILSSVCFLVFPIPLKTVKFLLNIFY
jgi:hypothetical protein